MCACSREWTLRWWLQASHGHGVAMRHCQPDSVTSSSTRGDWNEQLQMVVHSPAAEKGCPRVCAIREMSSPALAAPPGHLDAFSGDCLTVRIPCSRGRGKRSQNSSHEPVPSRNPPHPPGGYFSKSHSGGHLADTNTCLKEICL